MKEKVAVATVQGKSYYLIVNALKEQKISFTSMVPGELVSPRVKVAVTTEEEKDKVKFKKVLIFNSDVELESLVFEVKKLLLGKETYEKIIIGIDPGEVIGLVVMSDGKSLEERNCYSSKEMVNNILKILRTVDYSVTHVVIKMGNGVPLYRKLLEDLDYALPSYVILEVVDESGTNRYVKEHNREIRHISSAIRIAGRVGQEFTRRKYIATNDTNQ